MYYKDMDNIRKSILGHYVERIENILGRTEPEELRKAHKLKLKSACGIVINGNKVLLGLSNADDDRFEKWCFAGGGIDKNEDCISAAIRETYEEMGIVAELYMSSILVHTTKPFVGFCVLKTTTDKIKVNEEFDGADWFDIDMLPENIHPINLEILKMINVKEI